MSIRRLPDAELEIMQVVWALDPPVARIEIEAVLKDSYPLAPTTILTLLSRLEERGFLRVEKSGRSNHYTPLISRRDYLASQSRSFLDQLFHGDLAAFATALNDSGLSQAELTTLRDLLERDEL